MEAVYADENVWLSQRMMAQLYDVEVPTMTADAGALVELEASAHAEGILPAGKGRRLRAV